MNAKLLIPRALPAAFVIQFLLVITAGAITRTVGNAGADFTSLKAAITASSSGDIIDIRSTVTEAGIIVNKNLTIRSTLATPQIVQAATTPNSAGDRVFYIGPGTTVTLENLIIRHGVFAYGGGVANFGNTTLQNVRVEHNSSGTGGGGILSSGAGSALVLVSCTVESNYSAMHGGGLLMENGSMAGVLRSTFAKNHSREGGAVKSMSSAIVLLENSTLSMNRSENGGGGLFVSNGRAEVQSCTFSHNILRAVQNNNPASDSCILRNTILANSLTFNFLPGGEDCAVFSGAAITDMGYNMIENRGSVPFSGPGSVTGTDPQLGALAHHGGPTRTQALGFASPALNSGDSLSTTDQRGTIRTQGSADDKGAFEFLAAGEQTRPAGFAAPVSVAGEYFIAEYKAIQFRSPNFAVQVQAANGSLSAFTPDFFNHATYFGTLDNNPRALAGATYFPKDGQVYYHVIFDNGKEWDNEGGATRVRYLDPSPTTTWPGMDVPAGGAGSKLFAAEVAVDLPSARFISKHGSNANDALALIEHSLMAANLVYMRQGGIQHQLGRVILRGSTARDPYAGQTTHDEALVTVTDLWKNVLYTPAAPGTYDLVVVVHSEDSGGLAPVGAIGSPQGYSSCASTPRGDFSGVFRHEAGHNWSLGHFDGTAPEGQTINSGNQNGRFSGPEQALLIDFRNDKAAYLTDLGAATVPVPPSAATDRAFLRGNTGGMFINLLANDHDANGDALTLVSFSPLSELSLNGSLSATTIPGTVQYNRSPGSTPNTAIDRFRYRIRDASGLESEGFVFVRLNHIVANGIYSQNFNSLPNGALTVGDGSYSGAPGVEGVVPVSVQGGALQMNPDTTWQYNTFTIPSPAGLDSGFLLNFRFSLTAAGTPADFIAVNFGRQSNSARTFTGLTTEFNSYNPEGVSVRVAGTTVPDGFSAKTGLVNNGYHNVEVFYLPDLGVSVKLDGVPLFTNLAVPGFVPGWDSLISFSSYTGGLSQRVLLDDLVLLGPTADEDSDGIPTLYEITNGLNRSNAADAASDSDGDGFSALLESRFGTAANSRPSQPVWSIARLNSSTARINFGPTKAGRTYLIKSSTGGAFTTHTTYTPVSDSPSASLDVPTSDPRRMFRLEIPPP